MKFYVLLDINIENQMTTLVHVVYMTTEVLERINKLLRKEARNREKCRKAYQEKNTVTTTRQRAPIQTYFYVVGTLNEVGEFTAAIHPTSSGDSTVLKITNADFNE